MRRACDLLAHASPPITDSQLRRENSLLKTQEAVTAYKNLALQNICQSSRIHILKKTTTSRTHQRKVIILRNIFLSLAVLSWWLVGFLFWFLIALCWKYLRACGNFLLSLYILRIPESMRVDFLGDFSGTINPRDIFFGKLTAWESFLLGKFVWHWRLMKDISFTWSYVNLWIIPLVCFWYAFCYWKMKQKGH